MPMLRTFLLNLSGQLVNMVTFFKNILLGAIVAIYMLYNKERLHCQAEKKTVYALLGLDHGNAVIRDCQYVNQEFSGFLVGKVIDSIIIGAICYLVTSLIGTPYALLVSVIIGVTNIIPFFRPVPRRRSVSSADPSDRPSAGTVFPDFRRSPAAV